MREKQTYRSDTKRLIDPVSRGCVADRIRSVYQDAKKWGAPRWAARMMAREVLMAARHAACVYVALPPERV